MRRVALSAFFMSSRAGGVRVKVLSAGVMGTWLTEGLKVLPGVKVTSFDKQLGKVIGDAASR